MLAVEGIVQIVIPEQAHPSLQAEISCLKTKLASTQGAKASQSDPTETEEVGGTAAECFREGGPDREVGVSFAKGCIISVSIVSDRQRAFLILFHRCSSFFIGPLPAEDLPLGFENGKNACLRRLCVLCGVSSYCFLSCQTSYYFHHKVLATTTQITQLRKIASVGPTLPSLARN